MTGGAFVPDGLWAGYDRSYLYSDFACGKIFRLDRVPGGEFTRTEFMTGAKGPVHLRFGPNGATSALYYLSYFGGDVHRVARTGSNSAPVADFAYTPNGGQVSFDGSSSATETSPRGPGTSETAAL